MEKGFGDRRFILRPDRAGSSSQPEGRMLSASERYDIAMNKLKNEDFLKEGLVSQYVVPLVFEATNAAMEMQAKTGDELVTHKRLVEAYQAGAGILANKMGFSDGVESLVAEFIHGAIVSTQEIVRLQADRQ